jgi:LssY C-terminus
VWIGAATHDIGIKFATEERSFTHAVDARIDLERQKVVDDLRFARAVGPATFMERPSVPAQMVNATQDSMQTDGRIAILTFR